jgi:hypothetical protein
VEELRDNVESARATRVERRTATADLWVRTLQAVEDARKALQEEDEAVRAEEGLE